MARRERAERAGAGVMVKWISPEVWSASWLAEAVLSARSPMAACGP